MKLFREYQLDDEVEGISFAFLPTLARYNNSNKHYWIWLEKYRFKKKLILTWEDISWNYDNIILEG